MKDYDIYDDQNTTEGNNLNETQGNLDLQNEEVQHMYYEQPSQLDVEPINTQTTAASDMKTQQTHETTSPFVETIRSTTIDPAHDMMHEQSEEQIRTSDTLQPHDSFVHSSNEHSTKQEFELINEQEDVTNTRTHSDQESLPRTQDLSSLSQEEPATKQKDTKFENKTEHTLHGDANTQVIQEKTPKGTGSTKKNTSSSFINKNKSICLLSACFLLSIGGGFGGAMIGNQLRGDKTVLYQGTTAKGTNTNTTTGTNMSVKQVAEKTGNSVVAIKTESMATNNFFQQAVQSGAGSGVILSKDGYIVTNNHVIAGANKVTVTTKDGKSYPAKLIGTDPATDLAVIKITVTDLSPAIFGESGKLEVGDTAIAIGNPLGELGGTVTSGIISALDREITIENQTMNLLQTSAAINPGNSGGGLFNDQGQLIGVVNAKSSGSNIEGLGFAIPIDLAKGIISNLIEFGAVKDRAALGVVLREMASTPEIPSRVIIAKLEAGKAAEKAGLQLYDQILKIENKEVTSVSDVKTAINSYKAGDKINITVLRNSETKKVTVTLGTATPITESNPQQEQPKNPFQNN